jgi:hypothetical protein
MMTPLKDEDAIRILKAIAEAQLHAGATPLPPGWEDLLKRELGDPSGTPASEGDVARAGLELLKEEPEFAGPIDVMTRQAARAPGSAQKYPDPVTIALMTAALLVLQTRVKFKRNQTGEWSLEIEKKSSSDSILKLFADKLLTLIGQK